MRSYVKLALKVLARRKFFTFVSLFGISLTLVVLMVATAMLDNFFAPRAPESRFGRVLGVDRVSLFGPQNMESSEPGFALLEHCITGLPGAEETSIFSNGREMPVYSGVDRINTTVKHTDGAYWRILDFRFLEGRPYTATDDANSAHVAVISRAMREKLFGDTRAVGRSFELSGDRFTVVGVVPDVSVTRQAAYADIWVPTGSMQSSSYRHELMGGFHGIVLARSRADFPRLRAEFDRRLATLPFDRAMYRELRAGLDTRFESAARVLTNNREGRKAPVILGASAAAAALLFMLLPAVNLITVNLSRILERAPEIGVRKAFGAPRPALVRQFVFENLLLTLIGGALGFVLSIAVLAAMQRMNVVPNAEFDVNIRIFLAGVGIAVVFALLSGVYPAWRMSRLDPVTALRGGAL